jgi:hypothetical protein
MMPPDKEGRGTEEELAYIKYSAKELLFHQGQQLTNLQNDIQLIKIGMTEYVTRQELTNTRRWAIGAVFASAGSVVAVLRALGI